jgi:adenylate cyclase
MLTYQLRLLGPIYVGKVQKGRNRTTGEHVRDNPQKKPPRFRSRRTTALLGYLVVEQRPIARDRLTALFWPDWSNARGRANLRRDLYNLNQILPGCWELNRRTACFVPADNVIVDIYQLVQLVGLEQWEAAVDLLVGDFLEGLFLDKNPEIENWLLAERDRWRGMAHEVLGKVIEGYEQRGQYVDALHYSQRLLHLAPWDEDVHQQIMRLLTWTGQRGAALRQFETCKRLLKQELDLEPALETIALYQKIQDGNLELPPQLPLFLTESRARHAFDRPSFVAREDEIAKLDAFINATLAGEGQIVFVTGDPGRGKTALLEALTSQVIENYPSFLVVSGKCNAYTGIGDPYLPFRDLMAMLTGDLEGRWDAGKITREHARRLWASFPFVLQVLVDHGPHLLDVFIPTAALLSRAKVAGQEFTHLLPRLRELVRLKANRAVELEQKQLFQQLTTFLHLVSQKQPLLLIIDDIQWADVASVSLLFHLGRRLTDGGSRIMIICAYRPEEVVCNQFGERHPLEKVLSEFKRTLGDVWLNLDQTTKRRDRRFVDSIIDKEPNQLGESFRAALFEHTGGHPLFTVEMLRAMKERGDLLKDTAGTWIESSTLDWLVLPARVEAVIAERIAQLDPELREILAIASVEGELFTAQVIAEVSEIPERVTLRLLGEVLEQQQRLVREQDDVYTNNKCLSRYKFAHILFQDYLYNCLSSGERQLLHANVASNLEKLYEGQLDQIVVSLAHHYHKAGEYLSAFHYYGLAGERAARLHESREAINHYTKAIQLGETIRSDSKSLAKLHRGRGLAYGIIGDFDLALADYEFTLRLADTIGNRELAWRTSLDLGRLWAARDHGQAKTYFETALKLARLKYDPSLLAISLNWMGNWYTNNENLKKAIKCHQEALAVFEELEDAANLANTLDLLGIANLFAGDLAVSILYYDRAVALSRELNDLPRVASSLMGRSTTLVTLAWLTSVPPALIHDPLDDIEEARRIGKKISLASEEIWVNWALGLLQTIRGHFGRALEDLHVALDGASEIEHYEWIIGNRFALGILYSELFAPEQARRHLEMGLILVEELHSPFWIRMVNGALAGTYLIIGDQDSAQACLESAISPQTSMDTLGKRYCWLRRAELALAQDDPSLALDITERLIASAEGMAPGRVITYLWKVKAEAMAAKGLMAEAVMFISEAIDNAEISGERFLLWRLHASLARLYYTIGQMENAKEEHSTAQSLIDELAATISDEVVKNRFLQSAYSILANN